MPEIEIDQEALTDLVERFHRTFPDFESFQSEHGGYRDGEREYKDAFRSFFLNTVAPLLEADSVDAESSARDLLSALLRAFTEKVGELGTVQNMVSWRGHEHLGKLEGAPAIDAARALQQLWTDDGDHGAAIEQFSTAYSDAFTRGGAIGGVNGIIAVLGSLLLAIKDPEGAILVRKHLWSNVAKTLLNRIIFHNRPIREEEYEEAVAVARAVFKRLEAEGMRPADLWDVHNFLWVSASGSYPDTALINGLSRGVQGLFSRAAIEDAMDAFDAYNERGENAEIFGKFGSPRDYWVRSTRPRDERVYPTKPIVGFIQKSTTINGGWATATDAAARLYNAGYVIVDRNDNPVAPPERYEHLPKDADRVRMCARNYWIEPAQETGARDVSIRSGTLAQDLLLSDRIPNVCQALAGDKLQREAGVAAPVMTEGVSGSSTAVYKFSLGDQVMEPSVKVDDAVQATSATNMVLFGPPGTGKTYETAWEAVRLCHGNELALQLRGEDRRPELMEAYRQLVADKRVSFVTFHQSFSYEEFVEGLRPDTSPTEEQELASETATAGGFRLRVADGVFKTVCERARRDTNSTHALDRSSQIMRLGLVGENWKEEFDRAIETGSIEWAHGGEIDWSAPEYEDWRVIKARRQEDTPDILGNAPAVYGTWLIRAGSQVGDLVFLTVGRRRIVAVGRISGEYSFESGPAGDEVHHRRPVDWLWSDVAGVDRDGIYNVNFTAFHPAYGLQKEELNWDALETLVMGPDRAGEDTKARPHVLIIDEINRANISKVFGELITLLEIDKRLGETNEIRLTLPYSKELFGVPSNLHIVGTMNTADRSIALLDTALRRRFQFRELLPRPELLPEDVDGINLRVLLARINERIEYLFDRDHQIGHAYFIHCRSRTDVDTVMRDKVIPLLAEYFYEDWGKIRQVLGESSDEGNFVSRRALAAPAGMDGYDAEEVRFRYMVRERFADDAYSGFA